MRDRLNNRAGFDRVLMAVAATFLTVSATSAFAQADPARNSAAELAIDAAIPRPEPANVPPPTVNDFKPDTQHLLPTRPRWMLPRWMLRRQRRRRPRKNRPRSSPLRRPTPTRPETVKDTATTTPATPPAAAIATPAAEPANEPVKAASNVPAADQPVADKLKDLLGSKSARYFDRKAERAAIEKFYTAHDFAPLWTQGGALTATGKGVVARLKDAASDGLNAADYPVPDFAAANNPDALAEADLKLTASMMDYARQAQSGRMHWSQVSADISVSGTPDRSQ